MYMYVCIVSFFFFFKQKTAYEMGISDWSSDVCSADLPVEKLVSRKSAKAALRAHVGKPLVEFTRDIGHGCEARAALGDVDGPVLPRPIIEVLKQMLVKRAIAVG